MVPVRPMMACLSAEPSPDDIEIRDHRNHGIENDDLRPTVPDGDPLLTVRALESTRDNLVAAG